VCKHRQAKKDTQDDAGCERWLISVGGSLIGTVGLAAFRSDGHDDDDELSLMRFYCFYKKAGQFGNKCTVEEWAEQLSGDAEMMVSDAVC
jgi:hypothetical protein